MKIKEIEYETEGGVHYYDVTLLDDNEVKVEFSESEVELNTYHTYLKEMSDKLSPPEFRLAKKAIDSAIGFFELTMFSGIKKQVEDGKCRDVLNFLEEEEISRFN